jgi:KipI family sensor histidine kinase inhibitor
VDGAASLEVAGDQSILVRLGHEIAPEVHARVLAALDALDRVRPDWVVDVVPAYASLLVEYDGARVSAAEARAWVQAILDRVSGGDPASPAPPARHVEVPVWYDARVAPDLEPLAAEKGVDAAALAAWHTGVDYRVYALGFRPGFAFLGIVDPRLAAPRLAAPRPSVAAGSVGIAGRQTGVYPADGPGGWRIIGRTPLTMFDPGRLQPFSLRAGDRVRFVPIDGARFAELANAR